MDYEGFDSSLEPFLPVPRKVTNEIQNIKSNAKNPLAIKFGVQESQFDGFDSTEDFSFGLNNLPEKRILKTEEKKQKESKGVESGQIPSYDLSFLQKEIKARKNINYNQGFDEFENAMFISAVNNIPKKQNNFGFDADFGDFMLSQQNLVSIKQPTENNVNLANLPKNDKSGSNNKTKTLKDIKTNDFSKKVQGENIYKNTKSNPSYSNFGVGDINQMFNNNLSLDFSIRTQNINRTGTNYNTDDSISIQKPNTNNIAGNDFGFDESSSLNEGFESRNFKENNFHSSSSSKTSNLEILENESDRKKKEKHVAFNKLIRVQYSQEYSSKTSLNSVTDSKPVASGKNVIKEVVDDNPSENIKALIRDLGNKKIDQESRLDLVMYLLENPEKVVMKNINPQKAAVDRKAVVDATLKMLKSLAKSGIGAKKGLVTAEAQYFLGSLYSTGKYVNTNLEKAFELYLSSSKFHHVDSMYRVAICYEVGAGIKMNEKYAVQYYKKAGSAGHPRAMYKLALVFLKGLLHQQKQPREALIWLRRAAEDSKTKAPYAIHELAVCYEKKEIPGLINDIGYARDLYMKAAKMGYVASMRRLALAYEYGELNLKADPSKSIGWYTLAAEKNDDESQLALSEWYFTGAESVLEPDDEQAFLWAQKASNKGNPRAICMMGYYYELGVGVDANRSSAIALYQKAAEDGYVHGAARLEQIRKNGSSTRMRFE
ncbi:hypothetical protein BB559_001309 [Furculomyces boomerangus]|uniref:Uncharacterized protein n=1 Tax=Furculomyces boomerangus TaxID=61424 RepID=A0A2T9Z2G7_9FUNG|nr:hypothetical protein BB559_001309 [Furculomyces boomerangus]